MITDGGENLLSEFSGRLAGQTGLYFPEDRSGDLMRGISSAARQFGFTSAESYLRKLLAEPLTRDQIEVLASHLTIGETYFFRDKTCFDFLKTVVLPHLIRSCKENRRIRIWSAGCSSGEEPYSLAILLEQLLPDIGNWTISILATDINPLMLARAEEGNYSDWAFRDVPEQIRLENFTKTGKNTWKINEQLKRHITFRFHNLMEDPFPSLVNGTNAMDLILCRNVLMYFSLESARKIAGDLGKTLTEGGYLVFSPVEVPQIEDSLLTRVQFNGQTFFHKEEGSRSLHAPVIQAPVTEIPDIAPTRDSPGAPQDSPEAFSVSTDSADAIIPSTQAGLTDPARIREDGRIAEPAARIEAGIRDTSSESREIMLLIRAYANRGDFDEALRWCDQAIASDLFNPTHYYLKAIILGEQGDERAGVEALKKTLYLDPDFILASIALGSSARKQGREIEAARYFSNACSVLRKQKGDEIIPESGGITAGRMLEILTRTGCVVS